MAQYCVLHLFFIQEYGWFEGTRLKTYFTGRTSLKKGWELLHYSILIVKVTLPLLLRYYTRQGKTIIIDWYSSAFDLSKETRYMHKSPMVEEWFSIHFGYVITFALKMRKVMFWSPCIYLFISMRVTRITQKVLNRIAWNLVGWLLIIRGPFD